LCLHICVGPVHTPGPAADLHIWLEKVVYRLISNRVVFRPGLRGRFVRETHTIDASVGYMLPAMTGLLASVFGSTVLTRGSSRDAQRMDTCPPSIAPRSHRTAKFEPDAGVVSLLIHTAFITVYAMYLVGAREQNRVVSTHLS